jgi:HEAT repeat protein
MKKLVLAGLTCASLMALLPETGLAHGGQYRGPGDVTPPNPGGGRGSGGPSGPTTGGPAGPSTPGPGGPATPGPAGPATGGPAAPAAGGGPRTGGRGITLEDDLTRWEFWWEINKDPFIRLKDAIHKGGIMTGSDEFFLGATKQVAAKDTLKPTEDDILKEILPALKKAIDSTEQRDIAGSCMIAMAKTGKEPAGDWKLLDVFAERLKKNDQEIREVAALAVGIAAINKDENVDLLKNLALDTDLGRKACARSEVDERTRSFAAYGLGLLAYATPAVEGKAKMFETLKTLVNDDKLSSRNIKVAAINAIGLLNVKDSSEAEKALIEDALKCLEGYYMKSLGAGEQLLQSHVPTAIAKLIGRDHQRSAEFKKLFAQDLEGKGKVKRSSNDITRSCALALGQMCKPYEDDKPEGDGDCCKALLNQFHEHKDHQTKYFCGLALGQIGGKLNKDILIKEFDKARDLQKPWLALAMGVYAFKKADAARVAGTTFEPEKQFNDALKAALEERNPSALSGIAIGLGLCKASEYADDVRALLLRHQKDDERAGYLCIALALMDDQNSKQDIRQIVDASVRRPELLKQAAIALGKLGDKSVADQLLKLLAEDDKNLAKLSAIASAIGFIGDRRSIDPLKKILFDEQLQELSRAFAAVALGGVADKEPLPWNSKIGQNINYRASVETLTNKQTGILDIL